MHRLNVAWIVIASLLSPAVPASAQTAGQDTHAKGKAAVDPDKKTCRAVVATGSIMMGTRVCHTRAEWAAIDGRDSTAGNMRDPGGRVGGLGSSRE